MKTIIRPETEMKDSGVEWIKYVPENWNCMPLKRYFQFGKGLPITKADLTENGEKVISYGQIHAKFNTGVSVDDRLIRFVSSEYKSTNPNSLCSKGDIILADTSEDKEGCGNAVYIDCDEKIFAGYHTIILKSTKDNKYLAYLFQSDSWRTQIQTRVNGVKLFSITQKILNQCTIILPTLSEQQAIANYLDETCSKIDEIIAEAKASIDEYKELKQSVIFEAVTKGLDKNVEMKRCSVNWLDEIPSTWESIRLKYLLTEINNRSETGTEQPLSVSQVMGIVPSYMIAVANPTASYVGQKIVEPNDIVFNKLKAHLGVFFMSKYHGLVSSDYAVYRTNDKVIPKYLEYLFHTSACISEFKKYISGVAEGLMRLYTSDLFNIRICLPKVDEQIQIVEYVENKVELFDSLIAEKESLIHDLEAYKKSLIYEVVTGKRRVV